MRVARDIGPWSIVPEWVIDADISDRAVRLYALLGRYADASGESFASRRKLAERLRCSTDSVDRAVSELVDKQAVSVVERRREDGGRSSNLYTLLTIPPLQRGGRTVAEGASRTVAETKNESQIERETSLRQPSKNGNGSKADRDRIWDAFTDIFGPVTTRSKEQLRGKHITELLEAGATPDEMIKRAMTWPQHFDTATLTESALVKWWDTLGRRPLRRR
jgi:hypothetical protein